MIQVKAGDVEATEERLGDDLDDDDERGLGKGYRDVRVWNPTIANLTLVALGSSAPEILLCFIELFGKSRRSLSITGVIFYSIS